MSFSIKDFFSVCEQIRSFLQIWSHLLKKSLMENFIFCAVQAHILCTMKYTIPATILGKIQKCYSVEKWGWEGTWLPWRPLCREPRDIVQMCYMFEFSHTMKTLNCNVVSSIEVVYIILRWLAYPCRYGDMIPNVKRFSCDVWSCFPFIATSLTFFRKPC